MITAHLVWLTSCTFFQQDQGSGVGVIDSDGGDPSLQVEDELDSPEYLQAGPNPYYLNPVSASSQDLQDFRAAQEAMRNDDWLTAEVLLKKITLSNSLLSGAWLNLAICYEHQGLDDEALTNYLKAIEVNPKNIVAYNRLAVWYRRDGLFEQAEQQYLTALQVWQGDADTHRNLAILYDLYLGELEQALYHYQAYQALIIQEGQDEPRLAGWLADLERRLQAMPQHSAATNVTPSSMPEAAE